MTAVSKKYIDKLNDIVDKYNTIYIIGQSKWSPFMFKWVYLLTLILKLKISNLKLLIT